LPIGANGRRAGLRRDRCGHRRRHRGRRRGAFGSPLSRGTQVVVTDLAQIAPWVDSHYSLRKRDVLGATVIDLATLGARQSRLEEISRIRSGDANPVLLGHAATLVVARDPPEAARFGRPTESWRPAGFVQ
jgi:hypothetical protein